MSYSKKRVLERPIPPKTKQVYTSAISRAVKCPAQVKSSQEKSGFS